MLRYFYILICIPLCFCNEYFEENHRNQKVRRNENGRKRDKSPVVQFDLNSFISNSVTDNDNFHDYEPYNYRNFKQNNGYTQSEDYYEAPINENIKKREDYTEYLKIGETNRQYNDPNEIDPSKNSNNYDPNQSRGEINENKLVNKVHTKRNEFIVDRGISKTPEKKCAFKHMKIPFFSRKKSSSKKQKKRTLFCFNCAKTYTTNTPKCTNRESSKLHKMIKSAYGNLCPKCIKKLIKEPKKEPKMNQIHNSREFFQNIGTSTEIFTQQRKLNGNFDSFDGRAKREDVREENDYGEKEERERRLKELQEVQNKVDQVEITTPKFSKELT